MYSNEATVSFVKDYLFFTPIDIISTLFGLTVLLILMYLRRRNNVDKSHYRYYQTAFLFKLAFVAANAIFYIIFYGGGGDSIAFWDGSVKLNNLFWKDPFMYFEELFEYSDVRNNYKNFDSGTGIPDSHIYNEPASFFVSKVASLFTFFTFKGYLLMSMIFAYVTTNASWRLFELTRNFGLHSDWHLALAIFFIPSLSFWCGGISKDTLMWVSVCYFLVNIFKIISPEERSGFWNWIVVIATIYVMYRVRSFMLVTVIVPFLFAYIARLGKVYGTGSFEVKFLRLFMSVLAVGAIFIFFQTPVADEYMKEAAVINKDMTTNKTYGANRYSLGEIDYSPVGMVLAMPASVMAGFYRPFIWEALNITLILNGIESLILMYFTFRFFFIGNALERIKRIRKHEFLIYAFFFALILAYFAGFTSILFGVLVRFKAPVLPFLVMLLTAHAMDEKRKSDKTLSEQLN